MVFFAFLRVIFILYNQQELYTQDISFNEVLQTFYHSLVVDMATASYLMLITLVLLTAGSLLKPRLFMRINNIYVLLVIILFGFITAGELGIYPEWKTKLSAKALSYLRRPDEAFFSISSHLFFNLLGIAVFIAFLGWYAYRKSVIRNFSFQRVRILPSSIQLIVVAGLLFLGLRGGIGPIPVSPSSAYFSTKNFLNHTAVNTGFNLAISMLESNKFNYKSPFSFFNDNEAAAITKGLNDYPSDSTEHILTSGRPNIVILLMESWSADLIESLGGEPGITPRFKELEKDGILFTDFYASGGRSQQAIASLIGGFPATPYTTITENAEKYAQLPSLVKILNDMDYHTSFYFGGQLTYGNIKAFLYHNEFDKIVEQVDFEDDIPAGRLGVHDEFLFQRYINDYKDKKEPFFSIIFTLSSHSPYDQPMEEVLNWGGNERAFINSAYYSDSCLGAFFNKAKDLEWYDNTLFIVMADHSHNSYRNHKLESFNYHRVPLFFYGPVIKEEKRGVKIPKISQTADVTVTLLNQLGIPSEDFKWGKDLLNPYSPGYAYFELHYAFGWKQPDGAFVYGWEWDHYYQMEMSPATTPEQKQELKRKGKAYMQVLFKEFLDL